MQNKNAIFVGAENIYIENKPMKKRYFLKLLQKNSIRNLRFPGKCITPT
jgi:hypothetical protein